MARGAMGGSNKGTVAGVALVAHMAAAETCWPTACFLKLGKCGFAWSRMRQNPANAIAMTYSI